MLLPVSKAPGIAATFLERLLLTTSWRPISRVLVGHHANGLDLTPQIAIIKRDSGFCSTFAKSLK
jgi:hypothetical protein